jgi:hypothetical protein
LWNELPQLTLFLARGRLCRPDASSDGVAARRDGHGKEDAKGGARQSMKKLVAVASLIASSLALQARAGDADGLTLTIGKFSKDGDGFVGQTLSVKNGYRDRCQLSAKP